MVSRLVALLLLLAGPGVLAAQGREWTVSERVLLGDFSRISAVAVGTEKVYAVSQAALLVYSPRERRWHAPYPAPRRTDLRDVIAALADPLDESVWLITRGGWHRFDPALELWESGTVPGAVADAALDQDNPAAGLFLRVGGSWYDAGRGGVAFPASAPRRPRRPATVEQAVRANPAIQATSALLFNVSRRADVRYIAAARADGFAGLGWYLGTDGAGLVYFAEGSGMPEPLPFGLPSARVDAVVSGPDGTWAVTERTVRSDAAINFVERELREVRWYQGPRATGMPFLEARRILGKESALWVATDNGVVRFLPREDEATRFAPGRGLPDERVYDLAQRQGRLVAATAHGLAEYSDSLGFVPLAPRFTDQAFAVALSGDTTWVGTAIGLFAAVPGQEDLLEPLALREMPSARVPIVDLAWRGDTLVALTEERLLWRDPKSGNFTLGPLLGTSLGRLHTLVNGDRTLFIAGDRGVGAAGLATPVLRPLTTPLDLPAEVTDLAADEDYLWVATLGGLVRFRLSAVR
jgi:hypothetical protein